jgi:hypothetical protein
MEDEEEGENPKTSTNQPGFHSHPQSILQASLLNPSNLHHSLLHTVSSS